jgi:hypothetical protein
MAPPSSRQKDKSSKNPGGGSRWQTGHIRVCTHWEGGWVHPSVGLRVEEKRIISVTNLNESQGLFIKSARQILRTGRTAGLGRWFSVAQWTDASRRACAVTLFCLSNSNVEVIGSLLLVHCVLLPRAVWLFLSADEISS